MTAADWDQYRRLNADFPRSRAAEQILGLVSGFPETKRRERRLAMIQAYIDDSGKEEPVFVLAGFVSSARQWAAFSDEWENELNKTPKLAYVKMKDAWRRRGAFEGFTEDQRDVRINSCWKLINKYAYYGAAVAVPYKEYREGFKDKISATLDNPYFHTAIMLISLILHKEGKRWSTEKIDFIFDTQRGQEHDVLEQWHLMKRAFPKVLPYIANRMGQQPAWKDEQEILPLQAADMLAWTVRRALAQQMATLGEAKGGRLGHPSISKLLKVPVELEFWTREGMTDFANRLTQMNPEGYEDGKSRLKRHHKNRPLILRLNEPKD